MKPEEAIKKDIKILKEIHGELEQNYFDDGWDLCNHDKKELSRITGFQALEWEDGNLAYFIDGMQRGLHLIKEYGCDDCREVEE